jgi:hypothetical protein
MVKMLMIMQHITLCTPCITLFNCDHLFAYTLDPAESKSEIQVEQAQRSMVVHKCQVREC